MARKNNTSRAGDTPALSPLELDVMLVVWELGDCTSAEVTVAFQKKRDLAPTTIRTVLSKLRAKGYLRPIPTVGRGFLFRAAVERDTVAKRSLSGLLSSFFENSPRKAIAYLLDDSAATDEDVEEIRKMLAARRRKGP